MNETTDLVAMAQTGTGKTAAFGLPILNMVDPDNQSIQALILAPTRELCVQISNDLKSYSHNDDEGNLMGDARYFKRRRPELYRL